MNHLTDAVEQSLQSGNWYAGLITALCLPDIAGWVDNPKMRSQVRYAAWFEQFVSPVYSHKFSGGLHKFLSGCDCYALRCSLLHQGLDETSQQKAHDALDRFQFIAPLPGRTIHCNQNGTKLQLQVDIFCRDICKGIAVWFASIPVNDTDRCGRLADLAVIDSGRSGIRI